MRYVALILLVASGCTTVRSTALYEPVVGPDGAPVAIVDADGNVVGVAATKRLEQIVKVSAGGKIEEGMLDFTAESIQSDGSNWAVSSGTRGANLSSPDVTGAILNFAQSMATQAIGAYQAVSTAEIEAGTRAAELNASTAATATAVDAAVKALGK